VEFRILGPLELVEDGRRVELSGGRQRTLLALLLLHANEVVSVDRLIDGLWGERPPATAAKVLQNAVSQLRRSLGDNLIVTRAPGYVLHVEPEAIDAHRFESLLQDGRSRLAAGQAEEASRILRDGLALWRGRPLDEFAYEPFAETEAARLEELRLRALEERLDADLALGRHADVVGELERLVAEQPLRERPRRQLMLALYQSGRQAEALQAYQDGRRLLAEEIGLEPGPALQQLEKQILTRDPVLEPPPEVPLTFPSVRTPSRANLPAAPTTFIGRQEELGHVLALLSRRNTRLLTITGAGGSGKTRLAIEAAAKLAADFHDGASFVDLAPLRDPTLVMATVARVLGTRDDVAADLRDKHLLLVLDNFEHVLPAALHVSGLLAACPNVKALVTSREPLHLAGEQEYGLAPLALPDALALFTQRAHLRRHDLTASEVDGEICRRLDCLPLGIELAAARLKVLEPEALLARLERRLPLLVGGPRDAPRRQQTLRATIEWSYELLSSDEQGLLSRLSVFAGGWTLDAAEAVCDADVDTMQSLVDKCLAARAGERFHMLDTIREFSLELLERGGGAVDLRRRHAEYQLRLAGELGARRRGPRPEVSLEEFEREDENMRAALEWLLEADPEKALRLALHLDGYWWMRDRLLECDHWLTNALRRADTADPILRADALREAGDTAAALGDDERARRLYEESLSLAVEIGATREIASALINLGRAEEGLALYREVGWQPGIARTLHQLADAARDLRNFERATTLYGESIALWRHLGIVWGLKNALVGRGDCDLDQDLLQEAQASYKEALGIATIVGSELSVAYCLGGLAAVAAKRESVEVAARLWGAVESIETANNVELFAPGRARYERLVEPASQAMPRAFAEGRRLTLAAAVTYALESMD
jgi:predicted ATPase/DNA-binding SARP family transcriptional activator